MPYTPPIKISKLAKHGYLDEEKFYQLLAEENNYIDQKQAKQFYLSFIRVLTSELRKKGVVVLPHIGYFSLVKQNNMVGLAGKRRVIFPGRYRVKFYINNSWRQYFIQLTERTLKKVGFDPREKLLNYNLEE